MSYKFGCIPALPRNPLSVPSLTPLQLHSIPQRNCLSGRSRDTRNTATVIETGSFYCSPQGPFCTIMWDPEANRCDLVTDTTAVTLPKPDLRSTLEDDLHFWCRLSRHTHTTVQVFHSHLCSTQALFLPPRNHMADTIPSKPILYITEIKILASSIQM